MDILNPIAKPKVALLFENLNLLGTFGTFGTDPPIRSEPSLCIHIPCVPYVLGEKKETVIQIGRTTTWCEKEFPLHERRDAMPKRSPFKGALFRTSVPNIKFLVFPSWEAFGTQNLPKLPKNVPEGPSEAVF